MRTTLFKIKFITFLKFFADALYTPFLILYLKNEGYNGYKLGFLLAIVPLFNILGNILLSLIANTFKRNKIILIILLLMFSLGLFLIVFVSNNFILTIISVALISFANGPSFNLEEGLNSQYVEQEKANYSFTRMFGSVGYLLALLLIYFLPDNVAYKNIFLVSSLIILILSIIWCFLPNLNLDINEKASIKELIKIKPFIIYFVMYFLFFGAFNSFDYYIPDYMITFFKKNEYSLFYALAVFLELIVIIFVGKISKEKYYKYFLLFALFFLLLRSSLFLISNLPPYVLAILLISRGIGWGTFLAIHVRLLSTFLNKTQKTIAILVLCVGQGTIASILNMFGSTIIENYGFKSFFFLIVICMTISFTFYFSYNLLYKLRKKKLENGNEN